MPYLIFLAKTGRPSTLQAICDSAEQAQAYVIEQYSCEQKFSLWYPLNSVHVSNGIETIAHFVVNGQWYVVGYSNDPQYL